MVSNLFRMLDGEIPANQVRVLTAGSPFFTWAGCFWSLLLAPLKLTLYILKKVFRKLFYFLAFKDAIQHTAEVFQEGYLLQQLLLEADGSTEEFRNDPRQARRVRQAVIQTLLQTDTSPLRQAVAAVLRESWRGTIQVSRTAARLWRRQRRHPTEVPESDFEAVQERYGGILERLSNALWHDPEFLEQMKLRFERNLSQIPIERDSK